jgi:hypothetical protein
MTPLTRPARCSMSNYAFHIGDRVRLKTLPMAEGTIKMIDSPLEDTPDQPFVKWDRFRAAWHRFDEIELVPESDSESPIDVDLANKILKNLFGGRVVPMEWVDDYLDTLNTARDVLRKNGIEELS